MTFSAIALLPTQDGCIQTSQAEIHALPTTTLDMDWGRSSLTALISAVSVEVARLFLPRKRQPRELRRRLKLLKRRLNVLDLRFRQRKLLKPRKLLRLRKLLRPRLLMTIASQLPRRKLR